MKIEIPERIKEDWLAIVYAALGFAFAWFVGYTSGIRHERLRNGKESIELIQTEPVEETADTTDALLAQFPDF